MRFSTIAAAFVLPLAATAAPIRRQTATVAPNDLLVLQFAELLERLEAQFYQEALDKFSDEDFAAAGISVPDVARQNFQGILEHELVHAQFLQDALDAVGGAPIDGCTFNFDGVLDDVATMAVVARVVEAVGVGAYAGASILVEDKSILLAAASILTIEARHQSILNTINGATSVPQAFDITLTPQQVLAIAGGFITGCSIAEDLGAHEALAITNQGVVEPGTLLEFDFTGIEDQDPETLSCQMIVGGQATALSFPISECVVPEGINGPVAIFVTNDLQPLATDLNLQNAAAIIAGPTIAFLDTIPDALGNLVRAGGPPVDSSEDISQDEAQDELDNPNNDAPDADAPDADADADADTDAPDATETETDTDSATESSSDAAAPTGGAPETPGNAAAAPPVPPIKVIGEHRIPA